MRPGAWRSVIAADQVNLRIDGEQVVLFADRALYWPRRKRLVIADLHLGKGEVFRKFGISLPSGGTSEDLSRLTTLLRTSGAEELWILGDVVHGPIPPSGWPDLWEQWRLAHAGIHVAAVPGNHDRALSQSGLRIELLPDRVLDAPFVFQHAPDTDLDGHVLSGHVHPVTTLPGLRGRWPSFWLRNGVTVLPAFSAFTGGVPVRVDSDQSVGVCAAGKIVVVGAAGHDSG